MKLCNFVFAFVVGCVVSLPFQSVRAQGYSPVAPGDVVEYDSVDYGSSFGEKEGVVQTAGAADYVQSLSAVANGPIFVDVTWIGYAYSYKIYANGALKASISAMSGVYQSWTLLLNPSTSYTIRVEGLDKLGNKIGEKTAYATTISNVPTGVAASQSSPGQPVYVRWNYLNGMTIYKVYRSSDNGITWITTYTGGGDFFGSSNEVQITFPCPKGSYKFAVTAASVVTNESNKSTPASLNVQ
ncbi:MAG: hypothetical protein ACRC46_10520 [Thermoguttaceae bacterium]